MNSIYQNNKIEKSAIVGPNVVIGSGNYVGHNTVIQGHANIGNNNHIGSNVVIGSKSKQRSGYKNSNPILSREPKIVIGDENIILDFVNIELPVLLKTSIKNKTSIGAFSCISHDSLIKNDCNIAANVTLGGYVIVGENSYLGMSSSVHQRCTIGAYSMIGMGSIVTKHIRPFITVMGMPAKFHEPNFHGINKCDVIKEFKSEAIRYASTSDTKNLSDTVKKIVLKFWNDTTEFKNDREFI